MCCTKIIIIMKGVRNLRPLANFLGINYMLSCAINVKISKDKLKLFPTIV